MQRKQNDIHRHIAQLSSVIDEIRFENIIDDCLTRLFLTTDYG